MISTQRLNITQHWQQVATGNATLAGCNTSATYHIYVGEQPPTAESALISDSLLTPTEYNHNAPVWVKLNVTNQLDEVDLIVMGQVVDTLPPPPPHPAKPYDIVGEEVIVPIGGYLPYDFSKLLSFASDGEKFLKFAINGTTSQTAYSLNSSIDSKRIDLTNNIYDEAGIVDIVFDLADTNPTLKAACMNNVDTSLYINQQSNYVKYSASTSLTKPVADPNYPIQVDGFELIKTLANLPANITAITFKSDLAINPNRPY